MLIVLKQSTKMCEVLRDHRGRGTGTRRRWPWLWPESGPDSGPEGAALPGGLRSVLSAHPASFTERLLTMAGFRWAERWVTAMPVVRDER